MGGGRAGKGGVTVEDDVDTVAVSGVPGLVPEVTPTAWPISGARSEGQAVLVPGTIVAGKYEIAGVLGTGGTSVVYRARSLFLDRDVALKVQTAAARGDRMLSARFLREMRLIAAIRHPAVIHVFEIGALPTGELAGALELVAAPTVHRYLRDHGPLSPELATTLTIQLLAALRATHALGIVHRDIKPGNLLLATVKDEMRLKVIDFGVARETEGAASPLMRPTDVLGTPGYMAPEQSLGGSEVGPRADLFAAGTVLFELLTGERLFSGTSAALGTLVHGPPPALSALSARISPELHQLLTSLVAADVKARPPSAAVALERLLGTPEAQRAASPSSVSADERPREVLVVAGAEVRRSMLARMVRAVGLRPTALGSIDAARWMLSAGPPRHALVLVDAAPASISASDREEILALAQLPPDVVTSVLVVARGSVSHPRIQMLSTPLTEHDLGAALRAHE